MQAFSIVLFASISFQLSDYQYFMIDLLIFSFIFDLLNEMAIETTKKICLTH
jgi:hypothetical protein